MKKLLVVTALTLISLVSKAQCVEQDAFNKDKWHLGFSAPSAQKVVFQVIDSMGHVVYSSKVKVYKGYNTPTVFTDKFKTGSYTLVVKDLLTASITKQQQ